MSQFSMNRGLIRQLKKLNQRIIALTSRPEKNRREALVCSDKLLSEQIDNELANTSAEVLKKYKTGARVQPISNFSIKSLLQMPLNRIASLRGIGPKSAPAIKRSVEAYASEVKQNARLRISPLDTSSTTSQLVKNLYLTDKIDEVADDGSRLKDTYFEDNKKLLKQARPATGPLKWALSRKKNEAEEAVRRIEELLQSPLLAEIELLEGKRSSALKAKHDQYWAAFRDDPARFYSKLEELKHEKTAPKGKKAVAVPYLDELPPQIRSKVEKVEVNTNGLRCILRPYQRYGVKYILAQGNVLLGDEMGLGKTIEAIASMVSLRNNGAKYFAVVCPASVLINWEREIQKHSDLRCYVLHGGSFQSKYQQWEANGGVAIVNFEGAGKFHPINKISLTVADEAHYIKNVSAARTNNTKRILFNSERILLMSGTPLENRLDEMVALLSMLRPDIVRQIYSLPQPVKAQDFKSAIAPVYFRRTKDAVWREMPKLQIIEDVVELTPSEKRLYIDCVRERSMGAFSKMRQISFKVDNMRDSSKMRRISEICEEAFDNNRKVIIFSFFLDTINTIRNHLNAAIYGPITGSISPQSRQEIIDAFSNHAGGAVLLSQIMAGGTGLNIQKASIIILCEPQFKPSIENQAIARAYRIGQTSNVDVHRLLCEKTVDERILQMVKEKQALFDSYADKSVSGENSLQIKESDVAQAEFENSLILSEGTVKITNDRSVGHKEHMERTTTPIVSGEVIPLTRAEGITAKRKNYCMYCGSKLPEGAAFCGTCGKQV